MREIYNQWKCTSLACINHDFFCFVDETDGKHYPLNATDTARWSKAIKRGNASLNRPTERLRLKWIRSVKIATNIHNTSTPTQGSIHNNFNINLSDLLSTGQRLYRPQNILQTPNQSPKRHSILNSSSVLSNDDAGTEFDRYFEYLSHKFKQDVEKLAEAKAVLAEQDLDLRGIYETDASILVQYGMTYGLALKIKRYIKDFQLEQA